MENENVNIALASCKEVLKGLNSLEILNVIVLLANDLPKKVFTEPRGLMNSQINGTYAKYLKEMLTGVTNYKHYLENVFGKHNYYFRTVPDEPINPNFV
jgi:hypothetical protein